MVQMVIILFTLIGIVYAGVSDNLYFDDINAIAIGSLFAFIGLCVLGMASTKLYITFLIFQIIAFPTIVDNFIPGIYYGNRDEISASIFPFFSHIDIYFLLGIIKGILKRDKAVFINNNLLIISVCILFLSSVVNLFYSKDSLDFLLIITGFFHLRYLIWVFLLFLLFDFSSYRKQLLNGLILSVLFLFIESVINTHLKGMDRLTSGSLGNNSFGNIIACITVYFAFILKITKSKQYKFLLSLCIAIGVITVLLSGTRMALLAGVILLFIVYYFYNRKSFLRIFYVLIIVFGIVVLLVSTGIYKKYVPVRFDIGTLTSKIHFNSPTKGKNIIEIEWSKETSSIIARMGLYNTSINMIIENPFVGIGSMRWNYHKDQYGFKERMMLDTHNGYLAITSQFGLFAVFFIYFIYFYPFRLFKKIYQTEKKDPYIFMAVISLGMAICDFSNAGIYKPQIFVLLCFNVALLMYSDNYIKKIENEG